MKTATATNNNENEKQERERKREREKKRKEERKKKVPRLGPHVGAEGDASVRQRSCGRSERAESGPGHPRDGATFGPKKK